MVFMFPYLVGIIKLKLLFPWSYNQVKAFVPLVIGEVSMMLLEASVEQAKEADVAEAAEGEADLPAAAKQEEDGAGEGLGFRV